MSRVLEQYEVDLTKMHIEDGVIPVYHEYDFSLRGLCGKVVYLSEGRGVVTVELFKEHPLYAYIKAGIRTNLRIVYHETLEKRTGVNPFILEAFVVTLLAPDDDSLVR